MNRRQFLFGGGAAVIAASVAVVAAACSEPVDEPEPKEVEDGIELHTITFCITDPATGTVHKLASWKTTDGGINWLEHSDPTPLSA